MDVETNLLLYRWLITICAAYLHTRRARLSLRRWGVRPLLRMRNSRGHFRTLFLYIKDNDPDQFFIYTRMNSDLFDKLLLLVKPLLLKRSRRMPLSPAERLAMTLKFLSQGGSMQSLAWEYFVGKSTAAKVVFETCDALWIALDKKYLGKPTLEQWNSIADGFLEKWNFPNCVGAIDGKHVNIQAPINSGSRFFNYKKDYSIVMMATCDHNYRFTLVDIGAYGSQSDSGVFRESGFGQAFEAGELDLPQDKNLPGSNILFPHFFVGDEAFPLKSTMMRPFPGRTGPLPEDRKVFNYRLSRARRVIENTFGILVARWRIFRCKITANAENVETLLRAAICLHNFVKSNEDEVPLAARRYCPFNYVDTFNPAGQLIEGQWRTEGGNTRFSSLGRVGSNRSAREVIELRNRLKEYMMTAEGEVV